ncbi:MAG: polyamine aminopropyltransferase [Christensenellales bacterium]
MQLEFMEKHTPYVGLSIAVDRQLYTGQSRFQRIDVFESQEFGKILTLDGFLMLTEKDEFIYHEMIVHVPLAVHPSPEKVLIIGGGDGGAVREMCRYETVQQIDLVEIDDQVISVSREFLPGVSCSLDDKRVRIYNEDGLRYIRRFNNYYDVVIVDSTDPFGPGEGLFTMEFYGNCYKALKEDGILVNQHENPFYPDDAFAVRQIHKRIVHSFPLSRLYQAHIPTYPSGHWLFGFSSKKYHPVRQLDARRWKSYNIETRYYNTNLHKAAFALPTYVEDLIKDVEDGNEDVSRL